MRILFCSYRDWANDVFFSLWNSSKGCTLVHARTPEDLSDLALSEEWDVIVLVGWSWKVPAEIVNSRLVIGMHPSDLPHYAGGSPIQHQILDGVEQTNATLFKLNEQFDKGEIIDKEPIDLRGHLNQVLCNVAAATVRLVCRFIDNFPNNTYTKQIEENRTFRRLKPEHSRLKNPYDPSGAAEFMTCKEMWDFIRCREDPYPNAYFEDETGRLVVRQVEFIPK